MRMQSKSSVIMQDAENGEVPDEARYKEPSKKEVELSRTLSAQKMEKINDRLSSLPGTPE